MPIVQDGITVAIANMCIALFPRVDSALHKVTESVQSALSYQN